MTYYISNDYLAHHGVKGMHWGIRKSRVTSARSPHSSGNAKKEKRDKSGSSSNTKKYIAIGAGLAAAGLATYGAVKYSKYIKNTAGEHAYEQGMKAANVFYGKEKQYKHRSADAFAKAKNVMSPHMIDPYNSKISKAEHYRSDGRAFRNAANSFHFHGDQASINASNYSNVLKTGSTRDAYKYLREHGYDILGRKKKL